LRRLNAFHGDTSLGGKIENHLVELLETFIDVTQVRSSFALEAGEVLLDSLDVPPLRNVVVRAVAHGSLGGMLSRFHRAIRDMKRTNV